MHAKRARIVIVITLNNLRANRVMRVMNLKSKVKISNIKEIRLNFLEEYIGTYKELRVNEFHVIVVLSNHNGHDLGVVFTRGSPEEETLRRALHNGLIGQRLGIIRIDNNQHPIRIRKIPTQGEK